MGPARFTPHPPEHAFLNVLEGHVDVPRNLIALGDRVDQFPAPMGRMGVEQPDPKIALDRLNVSEQRRKSRSPRRIDRLARPRFRLPQIHSVIGRVLADQVDLLNPFCDQRPNLSENRARRAAAMPSAHLRNYAKTAGMIASFRDLEISAV